MFATQPATWRRWAQFSRGFFKMGRQWRSAYQQDGSCGLTSVRGHHRHERCEIRKRVRHRVPARHPGRGADDTYRNAALGSAPWAGRPFEGPAQKLAFSHDGRLLFALDDEEHLFIWARAERRLLGSVRGLPLTNDNGDAIANGAAYGARTSMAVDHNGDVWLAAASAHPTRWTLSPPLWTKFACTWAGRTLKPSEWRRYAGTDPPADLSCRH